MRNSHKITIREMRTLIINIPMIFIMENHLYLIIMYSKKSCMPIPVIIMRSHNDNNREGHAIKNLLAEEQRKLNFNHVDTPCLG